jgi:hypothetical protein
VPAVWKRGQSCRALTHLQELLPRRHRWRHRFRALNQAIGTSRSIPTVVVLTSQQLDVEWRKRLLAIQDASARGLSSYGTEKKSFKVLRSLTKATKATVIPEVHTFRADEVGYQLDGAQLHVLTANSPLLPSKRSMASRCLWRNWKRLIRRRK